MGMLNADQWAAQQAAGTWSELFDRSALINSSEWLTVVFWLVAFWLLGAVFFPLTSIVFRPLKDKGWGVSKFFGLMVWGYTVWLCGSLGLTYSRRTILAVSMAYILLNAVLLFCRKDRFIGEIKQCRRDICKKRKLFLCS